MASRRSRKRHLQLTLDRARKPTGRGGWRPGAGRPRGRTKVGHLRRERFAGRSPQHVTLRVAAGVGSLRRYHPLRVVRTAIAKGGHRGDFRIVEFNLLSNHLHLIVEAAGAEALARGMQGFNVRVARGINRVLGRRGSLFTERYHCRALRTPTEVRHAVRYVLLNQRHHIARGGARPSASVLDPYSSAAWFDGWRSPVRAYEPRHRELLATPRPTAAPTVWLLTVGWKRGGLLAFDEAPAGPRPPARQAVAGGSSCARRA
jgi:REP element-mobilizing transposase RayT